MFCSCRISTESASRCPSVVQGRYYGNYIMLRKCYQRQLIPIAFIALVLENELQYHGLALTVEMMRLHRLKIG